MCQKIVSEYLYSNLEYKRLSKHDLKGYKTVTEKTGGLIAVTLKTSLLLSNPQNQIQKYH